MKKDLLIFLFKLISLTLVLGYFWFTGWQVRYPDWLDPIAMPFFKLVGVKRWWLALVVEHFTNIIPYIALVLSVPDHFREWRRGLLALFGGCAVIILGHLILSWAVYYFNLDYGMSKSFYRIILPFYILNDALPFVLWIAFYPHMLTRLFGIKVFENDR